VNIIAVYDGNESSDKIKALVAVLRSEEIQQFIEETYDGAVVFYDK
jgi:D-methionine transport system substrate-binding protein